MSEKVQPLVAAGHIRLPLGELAKTKKHVAVLKCLRGEDCGLCQAQSLNYVDLECWTFANISVPALCLKSLDQWQTTRAPKNGFSWGCNVLMS